MKYTGKWAFSTTTKTRKLPSDEMIHFFPNGWDYSLCERKGLQIGKFSKAKKKIHFVWIFKKDPRIPHSHCKSCTNRLEYYFKHGKIDEPKGYGTTKLKPLQREIVFELENKNFNELNDGFTLVHEGVTCAEPGCNEIGGTFIKKDETIETHQHFCSKHNARVQEAITA